METKGLKYGLLITMIGVLLLAGCTSNGNNGSGQKETLSIAGSTTVQPIAAKAAEKYMTENQNIVVSVAGGGSGAGIKMVSEGSVDIGTSSRDLTADEISSAGLKVYEIADDGIAIIVNPSNNITGLTEQQITEIFAGNITNFKEVGGPDKEIVVIIREEGSGTRTSFEDMLMNKSAIPNAASAEQQPSNGAVKATVASNPNAIGYISIGYVDSSISAVTVDGIMPSKETVKSGTYPISRKLYMVTKGEATGNAKKFIDYVLSKEGQDIVDEEGFIKLG